MFKNNKETKPTAKNKITIYHWFIGVCILCVICIIVLIGKNIFTTIEEPISTSVLTLLATVIGASYIANVLSHKDIEEINNTVNNADEKISYFIDFADKNSELPFLSFIKELQNNNNSVIDKNFINGFNDIHKNNIDKNFLDYTSLTRLEGLFFIVRKRHKSEQKKDDVLLDAYDKGILIIETLEKNYNPLCDLLKVYFLYRKMMFNFYAGYCSGNEDGCKHFIAAASYGENLLKSYNSNDVEPYLNNIIGESYSKAVHFYCNSLMKREPNIEWTDENNGPNKAIETAIIKLNQAAQKTNSIHDSSVYYRNLGCAYERQERLLQLEKKIKGYDKNKFYTITDHYKSSIICMMKSRGEFETESVINTYYVLLAYCHKYIQGQFFIPQWVINENEKKLTNIAINKSSDDTKDIINMMYQYASIAYADIPGSMKIRKLFAFSNIYMGLIVDKIEEKDKYFNVAGEACQVLDDDDWGKILIYWLNYKDSIIAS